MQRGIFAEIDLAAVSNNLSAVRRLAGGRHIIAVVKADAYGHGAVEVARRLVHDGVDYLAVAFTGEARELRDAGISAPVLVLFDVDIGDIFRYNLIPVVGDMRTALAISGEAEKTGRHAGVHIKVDTGMGRLGLTGDAVSEIAGIASLRNISVHGVMSHFSEADLADPVFARLQIERFTALRKALEGKGLKIPVFHIANSAAVITLPEARFDAVRPGLMLYGYSPVEGSSVERQAPEDKEDAPRIAHHAVRSLTPVMSVKARIVALRKLSAGTPISYGRTFITKRDSLIGVISAGYADGLDRRFSNNAEVLVSGKRASVTGRVCMDLTMVDLTGFQDVNEGGEVVLIGKQGNESIDAAELALRAGTIPYEILTSLGSRAKRNYLGQD